MAKFDKRKCRQCIYSGKIGSQVHCNYSSVTDETCLKRGPKGTVIDSRGEERYDCLLFESGKSTKRMGKLYVGEQRYERRG